MRKYTYDHCLCFMNDLRGINGMLGRYNPAGTGSPANTFSVLTITFYIHRIYFV
jgi:hypothetical protein